MGIVLIIAIIVITGNAADDSSVANDTHVVGNVTILDRASVVTCNSTDIATLWLFHVDTGVAEGQVLHLAIHFDEAEQAHIAPDLRNADAADGVVVAVESSIEKMILITYDDIVILCAGFIVPVASTAVVDVVAQLEEVAVGMSVIRAKGVSIVHLIGQQVEAVFGGDDVGAIRRGAIVIGVSAPIAGVIRTPLGVESHRPTGFGKVRDLLSVGIGDSRAVGLGVPTGKDVVGAFEGVGGERLGLVDVEILLAHRARTTVGIEKDRIALSPVGGVVEGAMCTLINGDCLLRHVAVAACPACKVVVALLGGVVQREGRSLVGVSVAIGGGHRAAVEVVGDGIGVAGSEVEAIIRVADGCV